MEQNVNQKLDLRRVICPMNFVKTKVKLEEMEKEQILELIVDDGESIQNIPRSIKEEGHKIIAVDQLPDTSFRIFIKKGGRDGR